MKFAGVLLSVLLAFWSVALSAQEPMPAEELCSYSILAWDPSSGEMGAGGVSWSPSIGSLVLEADADKGILLSQGKADLSWKRRGLGLLQAGANPKQVVGYLTTNDPLAATRQVGILSTKGEAAGFSGKDLSGLTGNRVGKNFVVLGCHLKSGAILESMAIAFESAEGTLAEKVLAALRAGRRLGGDPRGDRAAFLQVVCPGCGPEGTGDDFINLRVDVAAKPVKELMRLYSLLEQGPLQSVRWRLGYRYKEQGKPEFAQQQFRWLVRSMQKSLSLSPRDFELRLALARLYLQELKQPLEALIQAEAVLAKDSSQAEAWAVQAEAQFAMSQMDLALESIAKALELNPEMTSWTELQAFYQQQIDAETEAKELE